MIFIAYWGKGCSVKCKLSIVQINVYLLLGFLSLRMRLFDERFSGYTKTFVKLPDHFKCQ
jgi:hypothetical protein